jgi:hypothetical protein
MNHNDPDTSVRSRRKNRAKGKALLIFLAVIIVVATIIFWQKDTLLDRFNRKNAGQHATSSRLAVPDAGKAVSLADQSATSPDNSTVSEAEKGISGDTEIREAATSDKDSTPSDRIYSREEICAEDPVTIENFYARLDGQEYIKSYKLPRSSRDQINGIFQKLAATPPVVTRETDDLLTILKNTAHFFRVIGKDNITLAKNILEQENAYYEDILAALYRLSGQPDCLQDRLGLAIPDSAYYDYACFFLTTMGGRLYLFRRDSKSRMLVNYYSILMVDRANQHGTNSHGVDIRPAINALIEEMENSGDQLKLKEAYLDQLYALKEKYPEGPQQ